MATTKEILKQSQEAIGEFIKLSKYLFSEDAPYDVNEIPQDNPFHEQAKAISEEMGLNWEKMSDDESNRVMLNMLAEAFFNIQPEEGYEAVLTISFKKS